MNKTPIAILYSGRGTNKENILDACEASNYPARVVTTVLNDGNIADEEYYQDIFSMLENLGVKLVCLAGWKHIISAKFVNKWNTYDLKYGKRCLINIHPSILPNYRGLNTHKRVLEDYNKGLNVTHGCTVHYVDEGIDTGEIILQSLVDIFPDDTEETLAARVLREEHKLYPKSIIKVIKDNNL